MIRFAVKEDAYGIAQLVLVILKDMELTFVEEVGEAKTIEVLMKAIEDPSYRYGYARGLVKEIDGKVAGVAFGYLSEEEKVVDKPLTKVLLDLGMADQKLFIDPESFPNEWYLDTICVSADFRGKGVGSELLEALNQIAEKAGAVRIGLCVDHGNPNAQRLYEQKGFKVVGEQIISGHKYNHMQKELAE